MPSVSGMTHASRSWARSKYSHCPTHARRVPAERDSARADALAFCDVVGDRAVRVDEDEADELAAFAADHAQHTVDVDDL